jgi:hypothetical protein
VVHFNMFLMLIISLCKDYLIANPSHLFSEQSPGRALKSALSEGDTHFALRSILQDLITRSHQEKGQSV